MSQSSRKNIKSLEFRARLPVYARALAISGFAIAAVVIAIGFYFGFGKPQFRMKSFPANLSEDVVAEVTGYERRETEDGIVKYFIKADSAKTFTDNHQELENVYLEVFDERGEKFDTIAAEKAVYIPKEDKNFIAYFAGSVKIETRSALGVKTDQLTYTKETDTAEAEELVEFERENVTGKSFGAIVKIQEKRLELLRDVEINVFENPELVKSNVKYAKITAGNAVFDQNAEKIEFSENVFAELIPGQNTGALAQPSELKANVATAFFTEKQLKKIDLNGAVEVFQKPSAGVQKWTKTSANRAVVRIEGELKSAELFDNVHIETAGGKSRSTKINSGYALYEKDFDRFELKKGVHILTGGDGGDQPADIRSGEAVYEQAKGKIFLNGGGEITQGGSYIKADNLAADLYASRRIKHASARGNAFLKQTTPERTTEIYAPELNAAFSENQHIVNASSAGASSVKMIPAQAVEYTKIALSAPKAVRLEFDGNGRMSQMRTDGRTTIQLDAPNNSPDAANKRLTADSVRTFFQNNGKDLSKAEAVGNAELYVEPLRASAENYKTTITAPRFDCEFYPTGNAAKKCSAADKTKTVRVPTAAGGGSSGTQTLSADRLDAVFDHRTQDVERIEAAGSTKFSELDRNGIADRIVFTTNDQTVRLRGGEPTVWDSRARAKASEIDWDTRNEKSFLRGSVSTTYYNQKQTGGATPFENAGAPVFLTADRAEFDHTAETALYTGGARAWQDNNYVRAEKILLQQKQGQLFADGSVQSVLYDAKQNRDGKETSVPVYAAAGKMFYNREKRLLRYEDNVDIRQGTDRITSGAANVFLDGRNELSRTVVENNVVVTQPNRKASGDWAQYTAADESVILRGSPARVYDAEYGSSEGGQLTVFMREKKVVGESRSPQTNTGRTRSVYKVKKNE